jgi:hypothetical protein
MLAAAAQRSGNAGAPASVAEQMPSELADIVKLQGGTGKHIDNDPNDPLGERPFQAQASRWQCSNLAPIFIGMHRNAPLSPMKRVPGYTISMHLGY